MFGKKNKNRQNEEAHKEKFARQLLGKGPRRRGFYFPCAPHIHVEVKYLAKQLNIPLFGVAEHALELGMTQVTSATKTISERELLIKHITEVHVGNRLYETLNQYDEEKAKILDEQREWKFRRDRAARAIVEKWMKAGLKPEDINETIEFGLRVKASAVQRSKFSN